MTLSAAEAAKRSRRHVERIGNRRYLPDIEEFADLYEQQRYFSVYALGRTAPLDAGPDLVHALLALFPSGLVHKVFEWVPDNVQRRAVRDIYVTACNAMGKRLFGEHEHAGELAERLEALVDAADVAALPLAGLWSDPPRPAGVGARVERAATVLRELRGAGHVAVLTARGLVEAEPLIVFGLWREHDDPEGPARFFGWRDEAVAAAWERLERDGWVSADRRLTADARARRDEIEVETNKLAARPWEHLEPADRERTVDLLADLADGLDPRSPGPA